MRYLLFVVIGLFIFFDSYSQGCCSGGSGNPIAGGLAQGVLRKNQIELAVNHRLTHSNKYMIENRDTASYGELNTEYLFFKAGFGITNNFTMDLSLGYFLNKEISEAARPEEGFNGKNLKSSGISDLIIFPRYDVYFRSTATRKTEITVGLGYKIPLGSHTDSIMTVEGIDTLGIPDMYGILPPTVQPTTGSQDILFYTNGLFALTNYGLTFSANGIYIKKSYNSIGQRFGDYASVAVIANKSFFKNLGVSAQLKYEWIDEMVFAKNANPWILYSIELSNTGSKKLFFIPQLSYTHKQLTFYSIAELPMYQYVNGVQAASALNITFGLSYRFNKFCDEPTLLNEPIESVH